MSDIENPTPLQQEVIDWMEFKDESERRPAYQDLRQHGCGSGMVSCMVWFTDTVAFFERHKEAINELLAEFTENTGEASAITMLTGYDKEDPLCLEPQNQNILAWYAFEQTAYQLYDEMYEG